MVPPQIDAAFTHTGMEARFRARTPREARVVAVAVAIGIVLPLIPMGVLIWTGATHPDWVNLVFGPVMVGVMLTLLAQVTVGPALFRWAASPAEVVLRIDERTLAWEREGERCAFQLDRIRSIERLDGEFRVEGGEQAHRLPVAGLKLPAIAWLDARLNEAWERRRGAMEESAEQRIERRRLGRLTERD